MRRESDRPEYVPGGRVAQSQRRQDGDKIEDVLGDGSGVSSTLKLATAEQYQFRI